MFQMSKKMFNKLWPLIAAQIENGKQSEPAPDAAAAAPSPTIAAEAGYVLGIAMGYALNPGATTGTVVQPRASIRTRQTATCGGLNRPRTASMAIPGAIAISRR